MVPLIKNYDPKIWFQVSRNKRLIARLPEGKTGIQALQDTTAKLAAAMAEVPIFKGWPHQAKLNPSQEIDSGEFYLRHLCPPEDAVLLSKEEFDAFRAAGGTTYRGSRHGKVA